MSFAMTFARQRRHERNGKHVERREAITSRVSANKRSRRIVISSRK